MDADILHAGFDGLRFTVTTDIPPELRVELAEAKAEAVKRNVEVPIVRDGIAFAVRRSGGMAFSAHTGEYGAEWYFLDPENRPANNPGVTVDFRAFLLATGGLEAAEAHFRASMTALRIPYVETQLRVSRTDFAVDLLAPWFEPDREALIAPPGTKVREWTGVDETETHSSGGRISGLRAGAVAGRQLVIYDKRAEVIATHKRGWLEIWNHSRTAIGKPILDLTSRDESQVWRFELRMGSKQLRNRWEMRSWADLDTMIGDAYAEFCEKLRYCEKSADRNRARWPEHELWRTVCGTIAEHLENRCSGVIPDAVRSANREEHKRMLDGQLLGLFISRAAAEGVPPDEIEAFFTRHAAAIRELSRSHPLPVAERLAKAEGRYRFR